MPAIRASFACLLTVLAFACGDNKTVGPDADLGPACSDTVDNDGDGAIDFPDDLGCESPDSDDENGTVKQQCQDNRDNDGDGKIDFPNDPGCSASLVDTEVDDCPSGPGCPQCGDGEDNDGNGGMDYPNDTGCDSAADTVEFTPDAQACGAGLLIVPLPQTGTDTVTLTTQSTSNLSTTCGGGGGAHAIAYRFHLTQPQVVFATTDDPTTTFNTVLDLRSQMCGASSSEITCNDNISSTNNKSSITKSLRAGTYYLIVQGKTVGDTGTVTTKVQFFPGDGTPCNTAQDCGPGLLCRIPAGETQMMCSGPVCEDFRDDDGDGKIDFPNDPGCTSATDSTETDVCPTMPTDPTCPLCGNGIDDDGDGDIDYPDDTNCKGAAGFNEACPQSEINIIATGPVVTGTTAGAVNDYLPPPGSFNGHTCTSSTTTHTAPDRVVQFDIPAMVSLSFRLTLTGSWNSTHILFDSTCGGTPIDCNDSATAMVVNNLAAGRYYFVIDGNNTASGAFTLNLSGTIAGGASCEGPFVQAGAFVCTAGYQCSGTPGSQTCMPTQCNDSVDNNGDGKTDFPNDPGCNSISDLVEDTVCPGPSCPVCSDGLDNDNDTLIDYPMDPECVSAVGPSEGCRESDAVAAITSPTTTGTLVGATDDHDPSCVTSNFPDKIFTLSLPVQLHSLVIDTEGSVVDTVLSLLDDACEEPSIACDDDGGAGTSSLIVRTNVAPGNYAIAVDSFGSALNTFVLNVKGTIASGQSCEDLLFQSGVLVCPPNVGCNGPVGSRVCQGPPQCHDGQDNNGDGKVDFPNDPGCADATDSTEDLVCPGTSCPACADGIDNDSDGSTDYPMDTRCVAASGTAEGCVDTDPIASILMPLTTGTLVGTTNDHQPTCVTTTGNDLIYTLTVPNLDSLVIDTEGSVVPTVLSFMTSDCTEPALACDDDGGVGTSDSLITRGFTTAGTYTIAIDATTTTPDTFNLNVRGDISPGESCESPLFATGVLRCSTGFTCDGPVGQRTCVVGQCLDGIDNNGDNRVDYPLDPGCASFFDTIEDTVCPGPSCPVCSDTVDNDNDTTIDYPNDTSCLAASSVNEDCAQTELVTAITQRVTTGNTTGLINDHTPSCGSTTTHTSPDAAYRLDLPAMETLSVILFDTSSWGNAHSLYNSTCGGTQLACTTSNVITQTNLAAGGYYLVVDGFSTGQGAWTLSVSGRIAPNGSCEGALFQSGAITCSLGHACSGVPGSRTCQPAACNDGMDNDTDTKSDFPNDPGCTSTSDNDEADDCSPTVGPNCPACSNAVDDDTDSTIDYPMDTRCPSSSFFVENFCPVEANIGGEIVSPLTIGTLVGLANNFSTHTCRTTTNSGADVTFGLRLPVPVATLTLDTLGSTASDTILSVRDIGCVATLGCDDSSAPDSDLRSVLTMTNVAAGDYAIIVDAITSAPFVLNVRGTVATGTACTSPLFASGVLACPTGTTCTSGTCQ